MCSKVYVISGLYFSINRHQHLCRPFDFIPRALNAETITKVNDTAVARPITSPSLHDLQIYGIIVTIILCFIVFGGVKMINRVAPAFLIPVLFSLFSIFIGILLAKKDDPAGKCLQLSLFLSFFIIVIINIVTLSVYLNLLMVP